MVVPLLVTTALAVALGLGRLRPPSPLAVGYATPSWGSRWRPCSCPRGIPGPAAWALVLGGALVWDISAFGALRERWVGSERAGHLRVGREVVELGLMTVLLALAMPALHGRAVAVSGHHGSSAPDVCGLSRCSRPGSSRPWACTRGPTEHRRLSGAPC